MQIEEILLKEGTSFTADINQLKIIGHCLGDRRQYCNKTERKT